MAGRGFNLLIVIVSRHALHRAAADYYRQENIPALYFTMSVHNFVGKAVDNVSTMLERQWQLNGEQGEDTISSQ